MMSVMVILGVGLDFRGRTPGCPVPFEVTCAGVLQLLSHSGSQPLLAGATVPNHQGVEPGERERWQILGQRGHFWPALISCVANEATQCRIRRESGTSSEVEETCPGNC